MKKKCLARSGCAITLILMMMPFLAISEFAPPPAAPEAYVAAPEFKFAPVLDGTVVSHDFIIQNRGKAPLLISNVKTGCGCTTADFTKSIEPGAEGHIRINGNTTNYGGREFSRSITVNTNDPKHQQVNLSFSGEVDVFAVVDPKNAFMRGKEGEEIKAQITIVPSLKYPFTITESVADPELSEKIAFTLEHKDGIYLLYVNNILKAPGQYKGTIHLKTDNTNHPEITVFVTGLVQAQKQRLEIGQ